MQRSHNFREVLPSIRQSQFVEKKKVKDLLTVLKQKREELQKRIMKTQTNQQEQEDSQDKAFKEYNIKDRVITQIPCYEYRKQFLKKTMRASQIREIRASRYGRINSTMQKQGKIVPIVLKQKTYTEGQEIQLESEQREENTVMSNPAQRKRSHLIPIAKNQIKLEKKKAQQLQSARFSDIFETVPENPKQRTDQNLKGLMDYLQQNNMFFAKINRVISTCFLKLNPLICLEKGTYIYKINEEIQNFYIILSGRVKLTNIENNCKFFKKVCNPGETIAEEIIFTNNFKKKVLENAKCLNKCYFVEIRFTDYQKMRQEMMRFGYKVSFLEMQSIVKRNYIMKNWQRTESQKCFTRKK